MVKIPVPLKVATSVVLTTVFYMYVGQMVPQKEVHPPEVMEIAADISVQQMVELGRQIFEGKGTCSICHTIGKTSGVLRFPDLEGVGARAEDRIPGMDATSYLVQSLLEPDTFLVAGFSPGMPQINKPPIDLTDDEILTVLAYLQSLGGEPTVTMTTELVSDGAEPVATTVVAAVVPRVPPAAVSATDPSADLENGKTLYSRTCFVCHGDRAQGNELLNAPKLAGQEAWYIERQLKNFASGLRGSDPQDIYGLQMRPMAMSLQSDQEFKDIANYLSSLAATR